MSGLGERAVLYRSGAMDGVTGVTADGCDAAVTKHDSLHHFRRRI